MKRLALFALVLLTACRMVVAVEVPYCPVSDSAKAVADSVPFPCLMDSVTR